MLFTTGLRSVLITECPRAEICFTETLYFCRVSNVNIFNSHSILECCVMFSGVKLSIKSFNLFGKYNLKFGENG